MNTELLEALHAEPWPAWVQTRDWRIRWANPAWGRFAAQNGGSGLRDWRTLSVRAALGPLEPFYREAFARVLVDAEPWEHVYECSTPELHRRFRMCALRLDADQLAVTNHLVVERPHGPGEPPEGYRWDDDLHRQCCHCRKHQHATLHRWDWVPALVASPAPRTSHVLCPTCFAAHYGIG